jgi:hypothetical protein
MLGWTQRTLILGRYVLRAIFVRGRSGFYQEVIRLWALFLW